MEFSYDRFLAGKFVVNCPTEEEAEDFCEYLRLMEITPTETHWERYKEKTAYRVGASEHGNSTRTYCSTSYYKENGIPIFKFSEITGYLPGYIPMHKEYEIADEVEFRALLFG